MSAAAAAVGLAPGMTLADARALVPALTVGHDDPPASARRLAALADWARRFTPWTAPCGCDGLWLDITGCGALFGGEAALLARLSASLARQGHDHRAAAAETPGAAWAVARFAGGGAVPAGAVRAVLAPLPPVALRLSEATAAGLSRVGLRRIGDLYGLPRAPLVRRFGRVLLERLDQALGRRAEPVAPHRPPHRHRAHRGFVEPVADTASITAALDELLDELCAGLAEARRGARRLALRLFRLDGDVLTLSIGTSRARRDARGLARLFAERLDGLDAGPGIEVMQLDAPRAEPLAPAQTRLAAAGGAGIGGGDSAGAGLPDLPDLIDRLVNRLGCGRVVRLGPRDTHHPDRAVRRLAPLPAPGPLPASGETAAWPAAERPIRLFAPPHPVEAVAEVPNGPPMLFRWRGRTFRVARAGGPERIAGEWWRDDAPTRDYYRVEDFAGARFWLYREGLYESPGERPPRWYLHGLFG